MDTESNILNISAEVLSDLLKTHIISLQELDEQIQARLGEKVRTNFISALDFLYLLGCLDYDNNVDAVYLETRPGGDA